jgi:hypothetical protein
MGDNNMPTENETSNEANSDTTYSIPFEYYAGSVITFIGIMVFATLLFFEMPQDIQYAGLVNILSGIFYVLIGSGLLLLGYRNDS